MSRHVERAVIFGSGDRGRQAYSPISQQAAVLAFVDNDPAQQHTTLLGHPVYPPSTLHELDFDVVYVASSHIADIRRQLVAGGVIADRIRLAPGLREADAAQVAAHTTHPVENSLSHYLEKGYDAIAGWLYKPATEATLALADIQASLTPAGPICEIGVWEGRYLSLLSFLPSTPQRVLAIDPLIHSGDRDAQRGRLQQNIAAYTRRPDLVTLLERDSKTVTPEMIFEQLGGPCQFVSVDGDHTMEGAMHDLRLAEAITAPGGIVALDDIPNFSCPGVTEAVMRHSLDERHQLAPFLLVSNKLFLTQKSYCQTYRREVIARAECGQAGEWGQKVLSHRNRMKSLDVPVRFLGQELLVSA